MHEEFVKQNFAITDYADAWKRKNYYKRVSDDPIKDLSRDLKVWRNQSQFLHESNVLVDSATTNFANIVIGSGINLSPKPSTGNKEQDKELADEIKSLWDEWAYSCHIDGQQDLSSVLRSIVAAIARDADVLVYVTVNSRGKLVLDLISSNRIESPNDKLVKTGSSVQLGVQIKNREITGYWVKNDTNKDGYTYFPAFTSENTISSVLLRNPSNTFRLNTYRGKPILSSCLSTVDKLEQLMDSELKAAILKTLQIAIYSAKDVRTAKGNSLSSTKVDDTHVFHVPTGDDLKIQSGSEISNKDLPATVKLYLQEIASSYNVPYNVLYNCLEDSSYSTNSSIFLTAWQNTEIWRTHLIRNLLKPIYQLLLQMWYSEGLLSIGNYGPSTSKVEFHGKPNIPIKAKDIYDASSIAITTGQKSRIQLATEFGLDAYSIADDEANLDAYIKAKRESLGLNDTKEELVEGD